MSAGGLGWRCGTVAMVLIVVIGGLLTVHVGSGSSPSVGSGTPSPRQLSPSPLSPTTALLSPDGALYTVNFTETGLPAGTLWQITTDTPIPQFVTSNSSTGSTISQSWSNGTYRFSASADRTNVTSNGLNQTFSVIGQNLNISVRFFAARPVTFLARGLAAYTPWNVSVQGNGTFSNVTWAGSTITLLVPVGPFSYEISAPAYDASPSNGTRELGSDPVTISIAFLPTLPAVGYLSGVVNVGSAELYINGLRNVIQLGGGFSFGLEPGSYSVIVTASGYIANYTEVDIVSNVTVNLYITLEGVPSPVVPNTAVPGIDATGWIIIGFLAAVAAVLGATTVLYSRRARRPPLSTPWTNPLAVDMKVAAEPLTDSKSK
jgi:hypothetical protein